MCLCNSVYCVRVAERVDARTMDAVDRKNLVRPVSSSSAPTGPSLISLVPFDQSVVETIEKIAWKSTEPVLSFLLPGWFVSSLLIYSYSLFSLWLFWHNVKISTSFTSSLLSHFCTEKSVLRRTQIPKSSQVQPLWCIRGAAAISDGLIKLISHKFK